MRTFEEIKNEVAKKHKFNDWYHVLRSFDQKNTTYLGLNIMIDEVSELYTKEYAREACHRQVEACADSYIAYSKSEGFNPDMADAAILNTPNAADENYKSDNSKIKHMKKPICCNINCNNTATKSVYFSAEKEDYSEFCEEHIQDYENEKNRIFNIDEK